MELPSNNHGVAVSDPTRFLRRPEVSGDSVALWRQLKQLLRDLALTQLRPGDQMPTEDELCRQHTVSRTTVRQAVASLVAEGVLYRRRGSGTYVARRKFEEAVGTGVHEPLNLTEQIRRAGTEPGVRLLEVDTIAPTEWLRRHLNVIASDPIHRIHRLRLAGDEPVAMQTSYVPQRFCPDLPAADLSRGSLRELVEERYGLRFSRIVARVEVVTADSYQSELLGVETGSPLVLVDRTTMSTSGEPVLFSRVLYRHDRYRLVVSVTIDGHSALKAVVSERGEH